MERLELSTEHIALRALLTGVFLVIAVAAFAYGIGSLFTRDPGWQVIEANTSAAANCSGDFTLLYELGAAGVSPTMENRALVAAYTEAAVTAYRLFNVYESFAGMTNLCDLNRRPNEVLTVDGALYEAFELLARYEDRSVYLGPVYEVCDGLFACEEDWQAADFDPYVNPDVAAFCAQTAAYARDPGSVNIELLGDNRVRLHVSEAYLAFAGDNGTARFVDFYWMTNAFIADYLAQALAGQGYTNGALTSFDGFIRNLDTREGTYALNLYDREGEAVYPAAVMRYQGPKSIVYLRGYPVGRDDWRFYRTGGGELRTAYADISDGLCKNAADDLVCYSDGGCAETLLRMIPLYVADTLRTEALSALAADGVYALWPEEQAICHTDPALVLTDLYSGYVDRLIG